MERVQRSEKVRGLSPTAASPADDDPGATIAPADPAAIAPAAIAEPTVPPPSIAEPTIAPAAIAPSSSAAVAPATTVSPVACKEFLVLILELFKIESIHALLESQTRIRSDENAGRGALLECAAGGHQGEQAEQWVFKGHGDLEVWGNSSYA